MSGFSLTTVRELPWVSFGLFCLTYGVFGWLVGETIPVWQSWILDHPHWFVWGVNPAIATQMGWGFGFFLVFLLMVVLAAPVQIAQLLFGSWLGSETKAIASVLGWAFAAVVVVCWLDQFAHFFVLLSAGMLCRFELLLRGFRTWQAFLILGAIGLGCFSVGGYLFIHWHVEAAMLWEQLRFA